MRLWDRLLVWRARRSIGPIVDETERDERRLGSGVQDWRRWWENHGERELQCILMTAWDPIRVGDAPQAWDEYDDYMAGVAHRLRDVEGDDEAADTVAAFLNHIERDYMDGLTPAAQQHNRLLTDKLVAWHEWSFLRRGRPPREWLDDD